MFVEALNNLDVKIDSVIVAVAMAQQAAEYAVKYGFGIMAYGHSVVNLVGRVKEEVEIPDTETADEAIKAEVW